MKLLARNGAKYVDQGRRVFHGTYEIYRPSRRSLVRNDTTDVSLEMPALAGNAMRCVRITRRSLERNVKEDVRLCWRRLARNVKEDDRLYRRRLARNVVKRVGIV
jgi:hypothetical protein